MDKLTKEQRERFVKWMNQHEDDGWPAHAAWAKRQFGVDLTAEECCRIYMDSVF